MQVPLFDGTPSGYVRFWFLVGAGYVLVSTVCNALALYVVGRILLARMGK